MKNRKRRLLAWLAMVVCLAFMASALPVFAEDGGTMGEPTTEESTSEESASLEEGGDEASEPEPDPTVGEDQG